MLRQIIGILATCSCTALAAPRALDGQVNLIDFRVVATAINPLGPAPGVELPYSLFGFSRSSVCHYHLYCGVSVDSNEGPFGGTAPFEAWTGYGENDVAFAWSLADMESGALAHIDFHPGAQPSEADATAQTISNTFTVLPNTIVELGVRVFGELGAANPDFAYLGWARARSHIMPRWATGEPMEASLERLVGMSAQPFDEWLTVYAVNDSDAPADFQWELASHLHLALPVPEPAGWGLLLAGLGTCLILGRWARARAGPLRGGRLCWSDWRRMRSWSCTAPSSCLRWAAPS